MAWWPTVVASAMECIANEWEIVERVASVFFFFSLQRLERGTGGKSYVITSKM